MSNSSIQFWDYLRDVRSHKLEGSVPQVYPHLRWQSLLLGHLYFLPTGYKSRVPKAPSSGLAIYLNNSQNSGKYFTYFSLAEVTTQEQPNGKDA